MAAALWQSMLVVELALAAALAWPIRAALGGPLEVLLALWLAAFLLLQPLLVLGAFALSGLAAGGTRRPLHARTVIRESAALLGAALAMGLRAPGHAPPRAQPPGPGASSAHPQQPPVLLVHGILCNGAIWWPLLRRLRAAGFERLEVMDLQPLFADIDTHAQAMVRTLHTMQQRCDGQRIVIVGHSMGGLVARAALRAAGPAMIARIITLGTPHHGTRIACRVPSAPTRQMCPDSRWLQQLNDAQEGRFDVPVTCLYSAEDTLIAPPRSAELLGARAIRIDGQGHLSLASSPSALARVLDELLRE